jgi:hypothetical protein
MGGLPAWMDDGGECIIIDTRNMPELISKLSNRFAAYTLRIRCRKCGHERHTEPHFSAKLLGWGNALTTVALRLRGSKCHVRGECELTATNTPKPRGYRSER